MSIPCVLTVFTTTFNRKNMLKRLYISLTMQTSKQFQWLIVDDGSTDGTMNVIESLLKADVSNKGATISGLCEYGFPIKYFWKPNGGKFTAMKLGFGLTDTRYMVEIDDDDELEPDAVETLINAWKNLEKEGKEDIAEIRAFVMKDDGQIAGCPTVKMDGGHEDVIGFEQYWRMDCRYECLISWDMQKITPLRIFDLEGMWLSNKVTQVFESLFYYRIGRKYHARYLHRVLRLYHQDAIDSITFQPFRAQKCYNYVSSLCGIINELKGDGWSYPSQFIKYIAEYMTCGQAVGFAIPVLIKHLVGKKVKCIACLLSLPAWWMGKKILVA